MRVLVLRNNTGMKERKLSRVGGGSAVHLVRVVVGSVDVVGGDMDIGKVTANQFPKAGSVVFNHAKPGAVRGVALIIDIAAVHIVEIYAVRGQCVWIPEPDIGVYQRIVFIHVHIVDIIVTGNNRFVALAVVYHGRRIGNCIILVEPSVAGPVIVKILSQSTAGKHVIVAYLLLVFSVNSNSVKRCGIFAVIVEIVDIVADQSRINAGILIENHNLAAVSWNPAETVVVEGKNRKILILLSVAADIVYIVTVGIDEHGGIVGKLLQIAPVQIHGIKPVFIIRVGEKNLSAGFTEQTSVVQIAGRVAVDKGLVVENPVVHIAPDGNSDDGADNKNAKKSHNSFFHMKFPL